MPVEQALLAWLAVDRLVGNLAVAFARLLVHHPSLVPCFFEFSGCQEPPALSPLTGCMMPGERLPSALLIGAGELEVQADNTTRLKGSKRNDFFIVIPYCSFIIFVCAGIVFF